MWSWGKGEPSGEDGQKRCAVTNGDQRFEAAECSQAHPFACRNQADGGKVVLRSGAAVDRVSLVYSNGSSVEHGGKGGPEHTLALAAGEHVTQYERCVAEHKGSKRVTYLKLATDQGGARSPGRQEGCPLLVRQLRRPAPVRVQRPVGRGARPLGFYFRTN